MGGNDSDLVGAIRHEVETQCSEIDEFRNNIIQECVRQANRLEPKRANVGAWGNPLLEPLVLKLHIPFVSRLFVAMQPLPPSQPGTNANMIQLLAKLGDIQWDIILISDTRSPTKELVLDVGHVLYITSGINRYAGTEILINTKHVRTNNKLHIISDRIFALDFLR